MNFMIQETKWKTTWPSQRKRKKRDTIYELNRKLIKMDDELNRKILCESSKGEKKQNDKCESEEMARILYEYKLNATN